MVVLAQLRHHWLHAAASDPFEMIVDTGATRSMVPLSSLDQVYDRADTARTPAKENIKVSLADGKTILCGLFIMDLMLLDGGRATAAFKCGDPDILTKDYIGVLGADSSLCLLGMDIIGASTFCIRGPRNRASLRVSR